MKLRGINFAKVSNAAGARNFDGRGYWHHQIPGFNNWRGSGFVAKTTTLLPRAGSMPLKEGTLTPRELLPRCIKVYPRKGMALNAVGLTGPGAERLLLMGIWQTWPEPFFLSFMAVSATAADRLEELKEFVKLLGRHQKQFKSPVGLELNFSCPNVGRHQAELLEEVGRALDEAGKLKIPLVPKFNALLEPQEAIKIAKHHDCDAICMGNTVPWGSLKGDLDWRELFGTEKSPLEALGGGGLSGDPLLYLVGYWANEFREFNAGNGRVKMIGCGGVMSTAAARYLVQQGAQAIQLGTVSLLRPWRVGRIIKTVNQIL